MLLFKVIINIIIIVALVGFLFTRIKGFIKEKLIFIRFRSFFIQAIIIVIGFIHLELLKVTDILTLLHIINHHLLHFLLLLIVPPPLIILIAPPLLLPHPLPNANFLQIIAYTTTTNIKAFIIRIILKNKLNYLILLPPPLPLLLLLINYY